MGMGINITLYKMGFDYWGCEVEPLYFNKGNERFEKMCKGVIRQDNGKRIVEQSLFF